jgi:hypothetical protein
LSGSVHPAVPWRLFHVAFIDVCPEPLNERFV